MQIFKTILLSSWFTIVSYLEPSIELLVRTKNTNVVTTDTQINPSLLNNLEFYNSSWAEYEANKTGPFSHAWGNRIVFLALQDLDPNYQAIAHSLSEQNSLDHLPSIYAENPSLVEGYVRQREALQSQFLNPHAGVVEITCGGQANVPVALQKPLSRGTILINNTNPDPANSPLIDFNTAANPVDVALLIRALEKARAFMGSESIAPLAAVELSPGAAVNGEVEVESNAPVHLESIV